MLFSSLFFLFTFLPFVLLINILISNQYRNKFLLISSLLFFAWGGVSNTIIFLFSIALNFFSGIIIDNYKYKTSAKKRALIIAIIINVVILCVFKYLVFFIDNINVLFHFLEISELKAPRILLPIGISFYTFHGLSYIIDVYRGTTSAQRRFSDLGLYIAFFPQLIAGPIIRYKDVAEQLTSRISSYILINEGMYRFIIGLGKKVLIANVLAQLADNIFILDFQEINATTAWIGIIAYTFQIYFDFAGYSDMAIGLALMFGFRFRENFNFPYLAQSIKDFWRRWHISLSLWFRDYLYIPLGGNKLGAFKTYRNLIIVFFITGFWHGASWSFVLWGLLHGLFMIIERLGFENILNKLWHPIKVIYTFFIVVLAWVLFRVETIGNAINYYKAMFNFGGSNESFFETLNVELNLEQVIVFIIASLGAFGIIQWCIDIVVKTIQKNEFIILKYIIDMGKLLVCITILFISTIYIASGSYNPFIYFKF